MFDFPDVGPLPRDAARVAIAKPAEAEGMIVTDGRWSEFSTLRTAFLIFRHFDQRESQKWDVIRRSIIKLGACLVLNLLGMQAVTGCLEEARSRLFASKAVRKNKKCLRRIERTSA
jgi:hypothetical protein